MAFSNTFTGKGIATVLPSGENLQRSQERMGDMILASEKIRQDTFQKNQEEFLKSSHIDPVYSLSKSAMESQAKALDFFNKKWGKVFQDKQGHLSMEDQTAMAADKGFIMASQARMKSDMDRMQQDMTLLDKDYMGRYDRDEWYNSHYLPFSQGEPYNPSPLPIKEQDFVEWARTQAQKDKSETFSEENVDKQGNTTIITRNIPPEQIPARVRQYVLAMPDAVAKNFMKRFASAPDKQHFIDIAANKENALILWAQNQPDILQAVVNEQRQTKLKSTARRTSSFDWNLGVGATNNRNSDFAKKTDIPIQELPSYKEYYDLQLGSVPTVIQKILDFKDARTGEVKTLNKAVPFKIVGYSPDNDKLLIAIEQEGGIFDKATKIRLPKGSLIEVDASLYDDLLKSKPYGFSREAILGKMPQTKSRPPIGLLDNI